MNKTITKEKKQTTKTTFVKPNKQDAKAASEKFVAKFSKALKILASR